jgi:hypothetical protein
MVLTSAMKLIVREVCDAHGVSPQDVLRRLRRRYVANARQHIWFRIRYELGWSYSDIGRRFDRDHTTIMWGVARHAHRLIQERVYESGRSVVVKPARPPVVKPVRRLARYAGYDRSEVQVLKLAVHA